MTKYDKYQLEWMINHDISLTDVFAYLQLEIAEVEADTHTEALGMAIDGLMLDHGFNGEMFACYEEWAENEGAE